MEWLLAITAGSLLWYADRLTKENTRLTEDRDYWRRRAIRIHADYMRLEMKKGGDSS